MITLKYLCDVYFISFNMQDVKKLSELFSDDIELIDWNISVKGKNNVLKEIQNIFNNVENIEVFPKEYYEDKNTVCCEISIKIETETEGETIQVVDIIKFDNYMKIEKITAYKR